MAKVCWSWEKPAETHDLGGTQTYHKEKRKKKEGEGVKEDMAELRRSIMARTNALEMKTEIQRLTKTLLRKDNQLREEACKTERRRASREREEERAMIRKYLTTTQLFVPSEEESYKRSRGRGGGRGGGPEADQRWT